MANSIIFLCCLAPNMLSVLQTNVFPKLLFEDALSTSFILVMVNSAINPFLYGVASPSYRRGFLKAFGFARGQIDPSED